MPCNECDHMPSDHEGSGGKCGKCSCTRYIECMFECAQCGKELNESQARGGHDLCGECAKNHNDGNPVL